MNKGRKSTLMTTVVMLLVAALIIYAFFQMLKSRNQEGPKERTEVEKLLERDLEKSYPANAREVIKFYNRIMKSFYNEELSEEELSGLADQMRILFDVELLKYNPADVYLENLKADIDAYKEAKRTIISITLQDYSDIRFETKGEERTATLLCYYLMKEGTMSRKSYIRYYLREDEEGKWRILFWELTDEDFN